MASQFKRCFSIFSRRGQQSFQPTILKVIGDIPRPVPGTNLNVITKEKQSGLFQVNLHDQSPLELFKPSKTLSVTDLSLPYCELQRLYQKCLGDEFTTAAMQVGTQVHEKLEVDAAKNLVGEVVEIPVKFIKLREDVWAQKVLNQISAQATLLEGFEVRELYIFGMLGGFPVTGYIDSVLLENGQMVIQETKTRINPTLPYRESQLLSAYHQVLVYHELLSKFMRTPQSLSLKFYESLDLDVEKPLSEEIRNLIGVNNLKELHMQFDDWPQLSNKLLVTYLHNATEKVIGTLEYQFDGETARQVQEYTLAFWSGQRPAFGVDPSEISKCQHCPYLKNCSWYGEVEVPPSPRMIQKVDPRYVKRHEL